MVPGTKNLSFWLRIWSIKRASLGVCVYYPFKYVFLWLKKITFWISFVQITLINEVLHGMERSELTLQIPRGSVLTPMKEGEKSMTLK